MPAKSCIFTTFPWSLTVIIELLLCLSAPALEHFHHTAYDPCVDPAAKKRKRRSLILQSHDLSGFGFYCSNRSNAQTEGGSSASSMCVYSVGTTARKKCVRALFDCGNGALRCWSLKSEDPFVLVCQVNLLEGYR